MEREPTKEEYDVYYEKLLNKFKQDPQYELKQEFGRMLMRHIDDFTPVEMERYKTLKLLLNGSVV